MTLGATVDSSSTSFPELLSAAITDQSCFAVTVLGLN